MKRARRKTKIARPGRVAAYGHLLGEIKQHIRSAQIRATLSANGELIRLYWHIGRVINQRQMHEGWGARVIPRLAKDLHNEFPELKGFSERNLKRMIAFYREYSEMNTIVPQAVAQLPAIAGAPKGPQPVAQLDEAGSLPDLQQLATQIPWGHHVLLMEKVKDRSARLWYVQQTIAHGWSRNVLALMIRSATHKRRGKAVTNFSQTLPSPHGDLAREVLKDPYIFDFLTLEAPFHERELETKLLQHLQEFLVELGAGFAFVGRQVHLKVGGEDIYLDLLFYHLRLRCFLVIDLKTGAFKAEYAGKMNLYINAVDDQMRHPDDQPGVGLILCQEKNKVIAEYALRGMKKAIGVSEYQLTRALPKKFQSALPSIKDIEAELSGGREK